MTVRDPPASDPPSLPHAAVELDEAQVLGVLGKIDEVALEQGRFATDRLADPRARTFAAALVSDCSGAETRRSDLQRALALTAAESVLARTLADVGAANHRRIGSLAGREQARAFVSAQVRQLASALDTVDQALLPNLGPGPLRTFIEQDRRPALAAQHARARELERALAD